MQISPKLNKNSAVEKEKKKKRKIKGERERDGNGFLVIIQYVFEFPFLPPIWFLLVALEEMWPLLVFLPLLADSFAIQLSACPKPNIESWLPYEEEKD